MGKVRDALGLPKFGEQDAEAQKKVDKEGEPDEPIEGQSALEKLRWAERIQQARVRKAVKMERMMGGMILPLATTEIKLYTNILSMEMDVTIKLGELKPTPPPPKVDTGDLEGGSPAEAYRVVLYWNHLKKEAEKFYAAGGRVEGDAGATGGEGEAPDAHGALGGGGVPGGDLGAEENPGNEGPGAGNNGGGGAATPVGR